MKGVQVDRWQGAGPEPDELAELLRSEGLSFYRWSNGPNYRYASHQHSYDKVILVQSGSIVFGLPQTGEEVALEPGDRLELPAGTDHDAIVGPEGVVCLEAHR